MTKEQVKKTREALHHMYSPDRDVVGKEGKLSIHCPMCILINNANIVDEMSSYVMWDDDNEIIYVLETNNEASGILNNICPMIAKVVPYDTIQAMWTRLDYNSSKNFLDTMVKRKLTNRASADKYLVGIRKLSRPETYVETVSPDTPEKTEWSSTRKGEYNPEVDRIMLEDKI